MYTYLCLKNAYQLVSYLWPVVTYTMTYTMSTAYALPLAYYTLPISYAFPYAVTYYLSAYAWWFAYYAF